MSAVRGFEYNEVMNVLSHLPRWAQGPTQKFLDQSALSGTTTAPLTQDGFEETFKMGAGAVHLAGHDEIPGEDLALGQPGIVSRNGLKVFFQGDSSSSRGSVDVALSARRRDTEYVTYVQSRGNEFAVLRMVNEDGDVEVKGSRVQRTAEGIEGYLLAGSFSV